MAIYNTKGFKMWRVFDGSPIPVGLASVDAVDLVEQSQQDKSILSMIYENEDGSLPSTDIAKYLGKNVNPEVRRYLEDVIYQGLRPVDTIKDLKPSKVSDDVLIEVMPKAHENLDSYKERISKMLDDEQREYAFRRMSADFARRFGRKSDDVQR